MPQRRGSVENDRTNPRRDSLVLRLPGGALNGFGFFFRFSFF